MIYEASKNNHLIFFIGSGVSVPYGIPTWNKYIKELLRYWDSKIKNYYYSNENQKNRIRDLIAENEKCDSDKTKIVKKLYKLLKDVFGSDYFYKHFRDYEKAHFIISEDNVLDNSIYYSLSQLDAAYFTTNYDNVTEMNLKKFRGSFREFRDIKELNDDLFNITDNTVFHLHGSVYGDPNLFISSFSSYESYYRENKMLKEFKNILSNGEYLLVFIGSSMEEDYILSLFDNVKNTYVAILRLEEKGSKSVEQKRIEQKLKEHNIEPFFYNESHSDFSIEFNRGLSKEFKRNGDINSLNYSKFRNEYTEDKEIFDILNRLSYCGNPSRIDFDLNEFLMGISNSNLLKQRIHQIFTSEVFKNGKIFLSGFVWEIINKKINDLKKEEKINFLNHLLNNDNSYFSTYAYKFYKKICFDDVNEKLYEFYEKMSLREDIQYTDFSKERVISGWILVKSMKDKDSASKFEEMYENGYRSNLYELTEKSELELYDLIREFESQISSSLLSMDLFYTSKWKAIYNLWFEEKIYFLNKPWKNNISEKFINTALFKMLIERQTYSENIGPVNITEHSLISEDDIEFGTLFNVLSKGERMIFNNGNVVRLSVEQTIIDLKVRIKRNKHINKIESVFVDKINELFFCYEEVYLELLKINPSRILIDRICKFYKNRDCVKFMGLDKQIWDEMLRYCDYSSNVSSVFINLVIYECNDSSFSNFISFIEPYISVCLEVCKNNKKENNDVLNKVSSFKAKNVSFIKGYFLEKFPYEPGLGSEYILSILNKFWVPLVNNKKMFSKLVCDYDKELKSLLNSDDETITNVIPHILYMLSRIYSPNDLLSYEELCVKNSVSLMRDIMYLNLDGHYDDEWVSFIIVNTPNCLVQYLRCFISSKQPLYQRAIYFEDVILNNLKNIRYSINIMGWTKEKLSKMDNHQTNDFIELYIKLLYENIITSYQYEVSDFVVNRCDDNQFDIISNYKFMFASNVEMQKAFTKRRKIE